MKTEILSKTKKIRVAEGHEEKVGHTPCTNGVVIITTGVPNGWYVIHHLALSTNPSY